MPPNRQLALRKYRRFAPIYDRHTAARAERDRRRAVRLLRLQPGDVAFDVGCGTGLCFPFIEERIGPEGRLVGIDQSPEMLARAREKVESNGWRNVTLIASPIEEAAIPADADAVLFCFVHDILQTRKALENVFRHVKPGARAVSVGYQWAPWWNLPLNFYLWYYMRFPTTTLDGFDRPWRYLKRFVPDLRIDTSFFGAVYFASGVVPEKEDNQARG